MQPHSGRYVAVAMQGWFEVSCAQSGSPRAVSRASKTRVAYHLQEGNAPARVIGTDIGLRSCPWDPLTRYPLSRSGMRVHFRLRAIRFITSPT